ncbi:bifunctional indole-3-glycerol-phosphate synthase TrpC/phosphoribosylanthranilate isomerase TrpF [Buchnera aphidicola (Aphis helianthi)]|uniref:Multifunctional fusion protein n=1 Tax=Buchnera aphidicola (Aphis helianthi) TaxID=2315802 RepID=A0A4D6XNN6_9GAMM|nr:bifunctional indole-3-glycerol-phosphate synthase TrpC/phosphoribosylanthranilate isomerase TrpF [Buchnera aphidicola]QCI17099.1 bifunctional indole-3-glycerol-phosphate synthase TrpC/phosphoribosylanthranilate isomerase TrpF [Buchnera aphidicola (Aphis helianthi)]
MQETILDKIIRDKVDWIKHRKKIEPFKDIKNKINIKTRNFYNVLKNKNPFFILECKKSSPSLGIIKKKFNLIKITNVYKKYASVISVLTDEKYFHGNLKFINIVRNNVSQPILCKDFFIDPYQVYLARYYNADAILLMLSILSNQQYIILSKIAKKLNMGVLTEVNNIEELNRAIELDALIIGINNRNLHDLSIDLNRTRILSPLIKDKIVISESGIEKNYQIRELSKIVNGFLIGSSLMSKRNLEISTKCLLFGHNKVCGLTRSIDAQISEKYGSVYGGLIFAENSLRKITKKIAKNIILNSNLKYIGIFQDQDINTILEISNELNLYAIQLHGDENQKYINSLRKKLPKDIKIWKAFSIQSKLPLLNWNYVNKYLFDSAFGGSNTSFNWSILKNYTLNDVILAGGINIDNITLALKLNCFGLDLNSGIEISPGIKDHNKIKLIFQKLRSE